MATACPNSRESLYSQDDRRSKANNIGFRQYFREENALNLLVISLLPYPQDAASGAVRSTVMFV